MSSRDLLTTAAVAAISMAPFAASSAPILAEAVVVTASGDSGEAPTTVINPALSATGTAQVGLPPFGDFAVQQLNGISDVAADSTEGGGFDFEMVTSQATLTQGETNNSGGTLRYFLDFSLQGLTSSMTHIVDQLTRVETAPVDDVVAVALASTNTLPSLGTVLDAVNPFGATPSDINASSVTAASFEYFIEVDGENVYSTRADALVTLSGGLIDPNTGTGPFSEFASLQATGIDDWEFSVAPISGSIELDDYADGETITVRSGIIARAYSHGGGLIGLDPSCDGPFVARNTDTNEVFNPETDLPIDICGPTVIVNGVDSFFSDPVTINGIGALRAVPVSAVPLPAAGWLLIAGLGGMVALGRRRKA